MQSDVVSSGKLELITPRRRRSRVLTELLFSPAPVQRSREQVAAICYRIRRSKAEFLLVRTRKGRWTFPKGGIVRGLTRAQSAALEAFEEAGVRGRIEEASFAQYVSRKRGGTESDIVTHSYLCEVTRTGSPQEDDREPTWFSAEKARLRLKEQRSAENGAELARVVEKAVVRIERLVSADQNNSEPLRRVQFESSKTDADGLVARFAVLRALGSKSREESYRVIEFDGDLGAEQRKILRLGPRRQLILDQQ